MPLTKVSAGVIAANAVQDSVGSQSITGDKLGLTAINANNIVGGAVTGDKLGATSINANNIVGGTITTTQIASNTISNTNIQTGAIEVYSSSRSTGLFDGMRNRIINGAMVIAQRGTGNTSTAFVNQVDQFQVATNSGATYTFSQSSTAPTGFIKSALNTNTSAETLTGTNYYSIRNLIEGLNIADLGWGTANAKTVTLSFWVRSSLTGTFGGSILNGSANYSYPFTYTISASNTFEYKTITIAGPIAGTWATDNGTGMFIEWSLGCGSTYLGTAGAWAASRFQGATGQVQLSQTNGATFYITGVQLEVGSTATSFDYRPYGTELALCQRYFNRMNLVNFTGIVGWADSTTDFIAMISFPVVMRDSPTFTSSGAGSVLIVRKAGAPGAINTTDIYQTAGGTQNARIYASVSSSLTAGAGGAIAAGEGQTGFMAWSAEL